MPLFKHEIKSNIKSLMIWTLAVGGLCFVCIVLYHSLEDSMSSMADAFSNMGAFSAAFGMDRLSLATLTGFYAAEVGTIHGLGGAMFAALLGAGMLSKEEAGHTAEFLCTLPLSRKRIAAEKYMSVLLLLIIFNVVCVAAYILGFILMGEELPAAEFCAYHGLQLLMQIEISSLCFLLSSRSRKNMIGAGLGIAIMLYAIDMMCRVIPAIEKLKYLTPFYYANASDIFSGTEVDMALVILGLAVTLAALAGSAIIYDRKDIAA